MIERSFEAFGTVFTFLIDAEDFSDAVLHKLIAEADAFEQQCSRFISTSEVCSFREKAAGSYPVSPHLAALLHASQELKSMTNGGFDPAVTAVLEELGYDAQYSFQPRDVSSQSKLIPEWSIFEDVVTITGPLVFDTGGIGKGYWIDILSQKLRNAGYPYHLVDGGGDMMASEKQDGRGWQIALEWPGKPETVIGQLELRNQGFAASDIFRRAWGDHHHIVDARTHQPVSDLVGSFVVAPSCFQADQLTSGLFFTAEARHEELVQHFHGEFLNIFNNDRVRQSKGWKGRLFQ